MPYVRRTKRRPSVSRRLKVVMVACLGFAAVLVLGGMFAMQQERLAKGAAEAASYTPAPMATSTAAEQPRVVFFGDSYTHSFSEGTFPYLLSEEMGWSPLVDGAGGTGYTATNGEYRAIPERVEPFLSQHENVDKIIFAAGLNDDPATDVAAAAKESWQTAAEIHPGAEIIVIGPFYPGDPTPNVLAVRDQIKTAAEEAGLQFIDPIAGEWFTGSESAGTGNAAEYIMDDGTHPNDAGQAYLAERIAEAL